MSKKIGAAYRGRILASTAILAGLGTVAALGIPADRAYASECNTGTGGAGPNGGTVVPSGTTCPLPPYNPRDNDNKVGAAVVSGGDTITLAGSGSDIEAGSRGLQSHNLGDLDPNANGVERLLLGSKTQGVSTPDPVTGANIVVATYNSANFQTTDWGQLNNSTTQTFVNVGDDQYYDARLGTVSGGTLLVDIGDAAQAPSAAGNVIDMAAKQTKLTVAEGAGSTIDWTSRNRIYMGDVASAAAGTTTRTVAMQTPVYAGTFTGFDGNSYTVTNAAELDAYNQTLIGALQAGRLSSQAAYDAAFGDAVSFTTQNATFSFTIDAGDDITLAGGNNSMFVDGAGATGIIRSGAQIDQRGAGVAAVNGAHVEIENGGGLSGHSTSLAVSSGSSAVNNGVISGGYYAGNGLDTTGPGNFSGKYVEARTVSVNGAGSSFDNQGILNVAGWDYSRDGAPTQYGLLLDNGATGSNAGIINVGVNNNALGGTINGVIVNGGSSFANVGGGTIYIGRAAQYDVNSPEAVADTANTIAQYGIVVNAGTATNDGDIVIGSKTQNATAMAMNGAGAGASLVNNGTIAINGAAGGSPLLNTAMRAVDSAGTVTNNGTIGLNGVNGIGLQAIGTTTATRITNNGAINIDGDADPASGTRNFGIWAEGAQAGADLVGGSVNLSGNGAIGVHARNGASVDIGAGAGVNFLSGTDQIGYFTYGTGTTITNNAGALDVSTERSTLFRVEDGASFLGTGNDLTASGKDATIVRGSGTGTVVDTADARLNLTGEGATAVSIDGGATGVIRAVTTVLLDGNGAVAGMVDGRKVDLSGTPSAEVYASTLTNEARIDSATDNAVGFITQYGGTLVNDGVVNLSSGVNNTGVIARSGGILKNNADITVANGTGLLVEGAGSASQLSNDATITVNNGIAGIHIRDGAFLNGDNSTGSIVTGGTAHGVLIGTGATGALLGANTITVNGTGNGVENAAEVSAIGFVGTTINVGDGAGIRTGTAIDPASTVTINVAGAGDGIGFRHADGRATASDLVLGSGYVVNANGAGATGIDLNTTGSIDTAAIVTVSNAAGGSALVGGPARQIINRGTLVSSSTAAPVVDLTGGTQTFVNTGTITAPAGQAAILGGDHDQAVVQTGGTITGLIDLGGGNNIYQQTGGTVDGSLTAAAGADLFTQTGGAFNGPADLGEGADGFVLSGGSFTGALATGAGTDNAAISGGAFAGTMDLGTQDDVFLMTGGTFAGQLTTGAGNDVAVFRGLTDANISGLTRIDGAGVAGGNDQLVFDNTRTTGTTRLTGWNRIDLVNASRLTADGNLAMVGPAAFNIDAGSTFAAGNGVNSTIFATGGRLTVTNAGTIDLTNPGTNPVDRLTIAGDYVGQNGTLLLDTRLGTDGSPSDALYFDGSNGGATVSGHTTISITNAGGLGADTNGDGILVIGAVNGATTTAQTSKDAFSLAGDHIDAGAFRYRLYAGDASGGGENWYLRTREFRPETPLLTALPGLLRTGDLDMLGTLHKRMGDDMQPIPAGDRVGGRIWGRFLASDIHATQDNVASPTTNGNSRGFQIGTDLFQMLNPDGGRHDFGIYGGYLESTARVNGFANQVYVGKLKPKATSVGMYWTYTNPSGFYFDTVLQRSWYGGSETASTGVKADIGGKGLLASVELGYGLKLGKSWILEPQAQIVAQASDIDTMSIPNAAVSFHDQGSLTGRLGLRLRGDMPIGEKTALKPYLRANLWHGFDGNQRTIFQGPAASTMILTPTGFTSAEVGGGLTWSLSRNLSLYGEVDHLFSVDKHANETRKGTSASVGVKIDW
ncbi:autotransporter outer membrane beta-barrel domain-containing protein [Sphingomonas sp. dw_22]|uniref:autotransporter outer membrane beta-barrel domain-containing protein n=1 Tax=Sphingomonas sp. dw_22 TaxID=2721175 RepID=UPI001BD3D189